MKKLSLFVLLSFLGTASAQTLEFEDKRVPRSTLSIPSDLEAIPAVEDLVTPSPSLAFNTGTPIGTNYCLSSGCVISATATDNGLGEAVLSANDLCLSATPVPQDDAQFAFVLVGLSRDPVTNQYWMQLWNGGPAYMCIYGWRRSLPIQLSSSTNTLVYAFDALGAGVTPGLTLGFQVFYSQGALGYDSSDGIEITFAP